MGFGVDQPSGAGDGHMIGRLLVECNGEELPERERVGQAPGDAALAGESFEEADHHDAEILAREEAKGVRACGDRSRRKWFRRRRRTFCQPQIHHSGVASPPLITLALSIRR
jgi:hypothetical protein